MSGTLYIAHLSFATDGESELGPWHGYCTVVVEAGDIDEALDKVTERVTTMKREGDVFEEIGELFLDSCVEIRSVPEEGLLAHFQEWNGEAEGSIAATIPDYTGDDVDGYHMGPEEQEGEKAAGAQAPGEQSDTEPPFELEPFVEF